MINRNGNWRASGEKCREKSAFPVDNYQRLDYTETPFIKTAGAHKWIIS